MFKWLVNLFKPNSLKEDENYESVDGLGNQDKETNTEVAEDNSTLDTQNILESESYQSDIFETVISSVQEKDSIYKMYESKVLKESNNECFLEPYYIKGYTKYDSAIVAGSHYRKDEVYALLKSIRDEEYVYIRAYCEKEPDNPHDSNAAKVMVDVMDEYCDVKSFHVGYLPREMAQTFKDIDEIPIVVWSIKVSEYTDVYIHIYAENSVYERAVKEKERLLSIKKIYDDNSSKIDKLIEDGDVLERDGFIDEAMDKFKLALELGSIMPHPANRLVIYYRKKRDYDSEMAVISQFLEQNVYRLEDDYFKERFNRAKELKQKQLERKLALDEKNRIKKEKDELKKINSLKIGQKSKEFQFEKEQIKKVTSKICSCCKQEKSIEDFNKNGKDSKGNIKYRSKCKECIKLSNK